MSVSERNRKQEMRSENIARAGKASSLVRKGFDNETNSLFSQRWPVKGHSFQLLVQLISRWRREIFTRAKTNLVPKFNKKKLSTPLSSSPGSQCLALVQSYLTTFHGLANQCKFIDLVIFLKIVNKIEEHNHIFINILDIISIGIRCKTK